jgi:uncharacterized membrane-anchored protein YhcB (DUF1043 family)
MAITLVYIFALLVPIVLGYLIYRAIKKDEIKNRELERKQQENK